MFFGIDCETGRASSWVVVVLVAAVEQAQEAEPGAELDRIHKQVPNPLLSR